MGHLFSMHAAQPGAYEMLVKCVRNRVDSLPEPLRAAASEFVNLDEVNLRVGVEYVALGVVFRGDQPWFLVCEDADDAYPVAHLWAFFSVVDSSVGEDWCLGQSDQLGGFALLPGPWSQNSCFMEELVDGDEKAVEQFQHLKSKAEARYS